MFRVKSLQLRFTLFLILPVAILLAVLGSSAFFYARDLLLSQWREASLLKLQRAAHQVDMRLGAIKNWISMFHESSRNEAFGLSGDSPAYTLERAPFLGSEINPPIDSLPWYCIPGYAETCVHEIFHQPHR
jgi:hypothetical protein